MQTVSPESVGMSSERLARIRPLVQSFIERGSIPGAITLVAREGKVVHCECHGLMDREAQKPMREDAILRIYSMTKPIASVALMMLVEEGRLLLSNRVSRFIPAFKDTRVYAGRDDRGAVVTVPAERPITVFDLLTHTAGLGYGILNDHPVEDVIRAADMGAPNRDLEGAAGLEGWATRIAAMPLAHQPGTRWRYSLASDVVGCLVQVISEQPFEEFLEERIFAPLGMTDTAFVVPADKVDRFSACYRPDATGGYVLADAPATSAYRQAHRTPSGGGGLVSTTADYLRFAHMLLNGGELEGVHILGRKTIELMTTNALPAAMLPMWLGELPQWGDGFGLGFAVRIGHESAQLGSLGMYGWGGAAGTRFRVDPAERLVSLFMPQMFSIGPNPMADIYQNVVYQALVN